MTKMELVELLNRKDFHEVYEQANRVRAENVGDVVPIRAILEFSNYCRRRCLYCGLNCTNRCLGRYRMNPDEMIRVAESASEAGYRTLVMQSGEDPVASIETLGEVVKEIKRKTGMAITLSCGELEYEQYKYLKDCGADRYLLKHETADPELYHYLHPDSTLDQRIACLEMIKSLGYETGGGFMIGLPGQTAETIAEDLLLLQKIGCDMAGIGPFVPNPLTPLGNEKAGDVELTERAVALARLLMPKANLPATTSLGVLDQGAKETIFTRGANVIMCKVTPTRYRLLYEIYPSERGDLAVRTNVALERYNTEMMIGSLGRKPL